MVLPLKKKLPKKTSGYSRELISGRIQVVVFVAIAFAISYHFNSGLQRQITRDHVVSSLDTSESILEGKIQGATGDEPQGRSSREVIATKNDDDQDEETKTLCQRAHRLDSMTSLQEQIELVAKEGGLTSQMYQDSTIISMLGQTILRRGGVYADVAASHPRDLSNTFILDKCYNWKGICVEADPLLAKALKRERSCIVVDTCVHEVEGEEVDFYTIEKEDSTHSNGIAGMGAATGQSQKMKCKRMSNVFKESNVTTVNFMSIDVESAEPLVLAGIDWTEVTIEIIDMEIDKHTTRKEGGELMESARRMIDILEANDYMPVMELFPKRDGMPIKDCTSVLLGESVRSVFQPNREGNFDLGVWRRQDVLFVKKGGLYEELVKDFVSKKAACG